MMPSISSLPKKVFNERMIAGLKAPSIGQRYVVWDALLTNFGIRVSDSGRKTFFIQKRLHGKNRRWTVGTYPALSTEQARKIAKDILLDISKGKDPKIEQQKLLTAQKIKQNQTFSVVIEEFIQKHVSGLRRNAEIEGLIRRVFIAEWADLPITDITPHNIVQVIDKIVVAGHIYAAHQAFAYVRKFFNWTVSRGIYGIDRSPCERLKPSEIIGKCLARKRILADSEIQLVWNASDKLEAAGAALVKLLLLTGQRLREVANMQWDEIDFKTATWVIPAERMKGDAAHTVPLTKDMLDIIQGLGKSDKGKFILTTTNGLRPISGFSKLKKDLDASICSLLKETENTKEVAFEPWRFHDLRRTMRTHLSALPVQDVVRELVISHSKKGLHKVYDQWAYIDEKREALALWSTRLTNIVIPPPDNVIQLNAQPMAA
jgi:integrase